MPEHLAIKKICSRWIPRNLSIAQKKPRVGWSKEMRQKYDHGASEQVYDIVTGDECWIYAYEPESKQQSALWVFQDEPNPTKDVFKMHVSEIPQSEWQKCFDNWFQRMQKCTDGEYLKKQ